MKKQARIALAVVAVTAIVLTLVMTSGFGFWAKADDEVLTLHGNVDIREVELGFRIPGRIREMPVEEGTRVAEGTLLARLDSRPLEDNLAAAQAQVAANQAELAKRRGGNRPQEITQAAAIVEERRAALARVRRDCRTDRQWQQFRRASRASRIGRATRDRRLWNRPFDA